MGESGDQLAASKDGGQAVKNSSVMMGREKGADGSREPPLSVTQNCKTRMKNKNPRAR